MHLVASTKKDCNDMSSLELVHWKLEKFYRLMNQKLSYLIKMAENVIEDKVLKILWWWFKSKTFFISNDVGMFSFSKIMLLVSHLKNKKLVSVKRNESDAMASQFSWLKPNWEFMGDYQKKALWSYLPTPPLGQDMTQGQFLSRV